MSCIIKYLCCYQNYKSKSFNIDDYINNNLYCSNVLLNIDSYNEKLNEECYICLNTIYSKKSVKNNCCNSIVHANCLIDWCNTKKDYVCPLCYKKL